MKTHTIISIAPKRFGGIDILTPLFFELKTNYDTKLIQFFYKKKAYEDLKKDGFLYPIWKKSIDESYVLSDSKKILKLLFNIKLFFKIVISKNVILLTDGKISKNHVKILNYLISFKKAKFFCYPTILSIKESNCSNNINKIIFEKKLNESSNKISIGFPKLYNSWIYEVKRFSIKNSFFKENQKLITVFVPSTVKNVFDEKELHDWLKEVLESISIKCPGFQIILKPHPMLNFNMIENIIQKYPKINIQISYLNPSILANLSSFIISHHSATILEALFLKKKVIMHMKFTKKWINRHPEGSAYSKLNVLFSSSQKLLIKNLEFCLRTENESPFNTESFIAHEYGVSNLFK